MNNISISDLSLVTTGVILFILPTYTVDVSQGKGVMNTYWLTGCVGYTNPLPDYSTEFMTDDPRPSQMPTTSGKVVDNKVLRPSIESGFNEADDADMLEDSLPSQSSVTHTFIADIAKVITPVG